MMHEGTFPATSVVDVDDPPWPRGAFPGSIAKARTATVSAWRSCSQCGGGAKPNAICVSICVR